MNEYVDGDIKINDSFYEELGVGESNFVNDASIVKDNLLYFLVTNIPNAFILSSFCIYLGLIIFVNKIAIKNFLSKDIIIFIKYSFYLIFYFAFLIKYHVGLEQKLFLFNGLTDIEIKPENNDPIVAFNNMFNEITSLFLFTMTGFIGALKHADDLFLTSYYCGYTNMSYYVQIMIKYHYLVQFLFLVIAFIFAGIASRKKRLEKNYMFLTGLFLFIVIVCFYFLIQVNNLFEFYIILEIVSLILFVLVLFSKYSIYSSEASLKYFLLVVCLQAFCGQVLVYFMD